MEFYDVDTEFGCSGETSPVHAQHNTIVHLPGYLTVHNYVVTRGIMHSDVSWPLNPRVLHSEVSWPIVSLSLLPCRPLILVLFSSLQHKLLELPRDWTRIM